MKIFITLFFFVITGSLITIMKFNPFEDYRYWMIIGIAVLGYSLGYIRGRTDEWTLWKEKKNGS